MDDNYIKSLSYDEKIIFFKIFCKLIQADGSICSEEIEFLKKVGTRYGIDTDTIVSIIKQSKDVNHIQEAQNIKNRQHSLQLIKEMCVLANIDQDLHDNELDIIIDVAHAMDVEDDKVILINRFVLDSLILSKTGQIIMEQDNE